MPDKPSRARTLNQYLDPYPYFGRLREAGRVVRIQTAFAGEGWLVTRHEDAQRLAGDPRLSVEDRHAGPELRCRLDRFKFRFADCLPETMLVMDPPEHTRLRRMVAREFTPRRVATLAPYIEETVRRLLAPLPPDGTADLVSVLAEPLPTMVICRLLGLSEQDATHLGPFVSVLTELPVDPEVAARVEEARDAVWTYLSRMIEEKRHKPDDGLLSALISAHDDEGRLTDTELTAMAGVLFAGGAETTTQMIGSGLLLLLRHPEQLARLVESPDLIPSAVDELLRFESPVTLGLIRYAAEDIPLADVTIPRGDLVFVGVSSANHDPRRFPEPDRVDVARRDNPHLAFGHGPHYCLGAPLARLELQVVLSTLLRHHPHLELACRPTEVPWRPSALRGPASLPVRLGPRDATDR
ncbi:cytochrome P450 [Streptomyces sp. GbtcB6]|uniref:cytochrome P450 family protein n=1 Tax=Streptomyces sp. GbtcB6 TaxID=2824751 RepID=UPI0027E5113B|nr:cytochrome P450 [Streptomyces sp. GbtcB6]